MSDLKKNLPQSLTLYPALFIFITSGMNIAWGLGFYSGVVITQHLMYCWFIGGIFGAIAIAFIIKKIPTKWLLLCSSTVVTIGGIIYASDTRNDRAIAAARYFNGFAFGWTFVLSILVGGEQVVKSLRGRFLSAEAMAINFGIFGQILYAYNNPDDDPLVHAIVIILLGILAAILAFAITLESPFYFLERNDDNNALKCLTLLQTPHVITQETHDLLAEHKNFIAEQNLKTRSEVLREGLIAMAKVSLHRCFIAMSFTLPLNIVLLAMAVIGPNVMWPLTFYTLLRFIGSIIFCLSTERMGRKKPVLLSLPICAGMLIGVNCLYNDTIDADNAYTGIYLLLIYQLFAGVYMGASGPQISEAFPLQLRPFFIAGVVIVEMLLQVIIVVATLNSALNLATYCLTLAVFTWVYAFLVYFFTPETKDTTLREAQAKFRNVMSPGF